MSATEESLQLLDNKLNQLRLDYERYFLGVRPREPAMLRAEIQKAIVMQSNQAIQNTALRFRFNSICSRFQALKRQWDETLRKMEQGTYTRHRFRAGLHERDPRGAADPGDSGGGAPRGDQALYEEYVEARRRCGQDVDNLSPEKLAGVLAQQEAALRRRSAGNAGELRFRVVVEDGKAKIKASRARD